MALSSVQLIGMRLGALLLGLFYSQIVVLVTLVRWALNGNKLFEVKERNRPPACLQDPKYGKHAYAQLKDVRMHFVENGDPNKPLMVFVHGFPEFWFSWRHQMAEFAATHWVVAIDMRGYGETDKPTCRSDYRMELLEKDIVEFVKALGRDKAILVAHDWGGVVIWNVAARNPNLVDKLIIMNSPHPETFGRHIRSSIGQFFKSWYLFMFQIPYLPEFNFQLNDFGVFNRIFIDENKKLSVTEDELDAYKYTFSRRGALTPPFNYYRQNLDLILIDSSEPFPKIKAPTLIVWGEDDVRLSKDLPKLARTYVTNLTIKYIPKGNHLIQQDKPQIVNSIVKDFLNSY